MTVEPGRGVAVSPGGGCGVARREEPVLSVALAGTFASSCAAQVLDAVKDEVGVGSFEDCTSYILFNTVDTVRRSSLLCLSVDPSITPNPFSRCKYSG